MFNPLHLRLFLLIIFFPSSALPNSHVGIFCSHSSSFLFRLFLLFRLLLLLLIFLLLSSPPLFSSSSFSSSFSSSSSSSSPSPPPSYPLSIPQLSSILSPESTILRSVFLFLRKGKHVKPLNGCDVIK
uniref:Uncharacterized protein n=1 Tax=Cacopsylla melanoneura TaxID=428564 RepID=A0A8D8PUW9_9HEMI